MKTKLTFLIIGLIAGVFCTILLLKIRDYNFESPERKKDAIIYAQKLIKEEFGKEEKPIVIMEGDEPFYYGIEFPPVSRTKVEITELKTYVIEFYAKYHNTRCVKYYLEENGCTYREGDFFYVELEYKNGTWNKIESLRISA
jgi:hypothetical protein